MNGKRIIASVISVSLIVVMAASFVPLSYLVRERGDNRANIIGLYAEENNSMDMIYIGGSACFVYWEPLRVWDKYGFTSYNFAHNSVTPEAIEYYIKEVQKTQTPELWLIDMRPFQYGDTYKSSKDVYDMYNETAIRNGSDSLDYSSNRFDLINASVLNPIDRINYYFDFAKYHSKIGKLIFDALWAFRFSQPISSLEYIDNIKENEYKGFAFIELTKPVEFSKPKTISETKLSPELDSILIDLLDYCSEEKLNVLFVVHSYCETEEDKAKYNYMERIIKERGFDFLDTNDYCDEIGLDYSFELYNENHVNVFGAEKYTDFLASYICEHFELPDRRDDANLQKWNELYKNFEKKTSEVKSTIRKQIEENNTQ